MMYIGFNDLFNAVAFAALATIGAALGWLITGWILAERRRR